VTHARKILFALALCLAAEVTPAAEPAKGEALPPWTPGTLDIHQLATGRGNAAFVIMPDGTTMLVDAGDAGGIPYATPKPDGSRTPAGWIVEYVRRMLAGRDVRIDYAVVTHFHPDHIGAVDAKRPMSRSGDYRLSGLTEVAEAIPIGTLVDRGWPDYAYLAPAGEPFENYRKFAKALASGGNARVLRAEAGSAALIVPHDPAAIPAPFEVRVIGVNDRVWTGRGDASKVRFPPLASISVDDDRPTENMCSISLRLRYGKFDFFTGGDMPGFPTPGGPSWHDLETDVARAIGATDAHVVNHHGSIEAENPFWVSTLRSRVVIVPAWSATHPSPDVLKRILSTRLYATPRDVFITEFREETQATTGPRASRVASDHGHVVVRVEPGGGRYRVYVLDDADPELRVRAVFGPYEAL
jgi:beta-lactamase superfamily II metal-dependent hydrolase